MKFPKIAMSSFQRCTLRTNCCLPDRCLRHYPTIVLGTGRISGRNLLQKIVRLLAAGPPGPLESPILGRDVTRAGAVSRPGTLIGASDDLHVALGGPSGRGGRRVGMTRVAEKAVAKAVATTISPSGVSIVHRRD